jgi:tetratricopeptide (TPR) repeat protein
LAPVALFTHQAVTVLDSLDERFSFQDKNLWFTSYTQQYPLLFNNYMNIARYRSGSHKGDVAIAYSAVCKALEMNPNNEEASKMLAQTTQDLRLSDLALRKSQLTQLCEMAEQNPSDNTAIFGYLNALIEYYRIENSIVNPQQMTDAVDLLKRAIQFIPSNKSQFQYILGMVLTGAGRSAEAAEEFNELLSYQRSLGTSSSIVSENDLLFNIGESYYNAGNLVEAEAYFKYLQSIDPKNSKASILLKKMNWKEKGIQ